MSYDQDTCPRCHIVLVKTSVQTRFNPVTLFKCPKCDFSQQTNNYRDAKYILLNSQITKVYIIGIRNTTKQTVVELPNKRLLVVESGKLHVRKEDCYTQLIDQLQDRMDILSKHIKDLRKKRDEA
ncbi:MAG: zf-TFIIB domain-containing protein [Patescibacteria group bacterium]|nr:zf-TFIIB domain-containing protein [Patescibacteria group bacterium]MDE2438884.1 zf-TFIIB domain-containing protein [Patescibacteria group bacterium]